MSLLFTPGNAYKETNWKKADKERINVQHSIFVHMIDLNGKCHFLSFFPGMSFAWLCRNTSESFPELAAGIINGTVDFRSDLFPELSNISGQGCYRDGQYLLSNMTDLELTTSQMIPDETYEIVLVVRKDNRTSTATQLLELDTENIPKLTIR